MLFQQLRDMVPELLRFCIYLLNDTEYQCKNLIYGLNVLWLVRVLLKFGIWFTSKLTNFYLDTQNIYQVTSSYYNL